jgi:hypothetical protein
MKILKQKSNNLVLMTFADSDDVAWTKRGLRCGDLEVTDVAADSHTLEQVPDPAFSFLWVPQSLAFSDGAWSVVDEVAYNAGLHKAESELQVKTELKASQVRTERSAKLAESDWTQLADAPVDSVAWAAYRQGLRDVPQQEGFPWTVVWPEAP